MITVQTTSTCDGSNSNYCWSNCSSSSKQNSQKTEMTRKFQFSAPLPPRYGDPLNPWGDLISMSQSWCLLRQGGTALVGVPSSGPQGDTIAFYEARLYGTKMHAQLFANFEQV